MGRILAAIFLILFIWVAVPHIRRGEWISPTAIAPGTWMEDAAIPEYRPLLATPPQGYGWYRFDAWNAPSPYGRPVTGLK